MYLTSNILSHGQVRHGFFTREGGVSEGIYAGLNCGPGSDDNPDHVQQNRTKAAQALQGRLCTLYQIHSADVITVDSPWDTPPKADAMVTKTPDIMLGILTADCAPILFADGHAGVVGAAHAGWKGAIGGVIEHTVQAMEALGAERAHIAAAVGPCIAQDSYEVGPEFFATFIEADKAFDAFFRPASQSQKYYFDLSGFVMQRLRESGLSATETLAMDTYADEQRFFSYRRTTKRGEADYGRQLSAIMMKG